MDVDKTFETQLKNIQTRTGKSLDELFGLIRQSGLQKHGEIRDMLKSSLGLGYGDANTLTHNYFKAAEGGASSPAAASGGVLDELYSGGKAGLRPIHDRLMTAINAFGPFETAPKKGYVSLRRKKQFAMIDPATKTRVEVGLNMKGVEATPRLLAQPPGGMCQYKVNVTDAAEVDPELIAWIRQAYEGAG
jgi:predicted transport protein